MKHQVLAMTVVSTVLALSACKNDQAATPAAPASASTAAASTAAASTAVVAPKAGPTLAKIFNADNIGRRIDIFERTAGEPVDATASSSTYEIEGCTVTVDTAERAITWISIGLDSPKCKADLSGILDGDRIVTAAAPLTYGELETRMQYEAQYKAPCIYMCGNAFDPFFEAVFPGSHAGNFIEVVGSSLIGGDGNDAQVESWRMALTDATDEDYVVNAKFSCERTHDALARTALATATVETLGFGHRDDPYEGNCKITMSM